MGQSLGTYLRESRLANGLAIEEVARATRVAHRYLEALEADRADELPAPVFTKGYIRAYCQVLGEPPDEALARYQELVGDAPTCLPISRPIRSPESRRSSLFVSLSLLITLGLGLIVFLVGFPNRSQRVSNPSVSPVATIAPEAPAAPDASKPEAPALTAPAPEPPPATPAKPEEAKSIRLVARTTERTWIRVDTDEGRLAEETLEKDATREWTSSSRFILTIGNAGGIALELNGQPLPSLGARGAVIRKLVLPGDVGAATQ